MATELTTAEIIELASNPQSMTVDGQTVSERSASDIITLDKYSRARTATDSTNLNGGRLGGWGASTRERVKPPGTVGE